MHTLSIHLAWGGHPLHPLTAHDAQKKNYFATAHMLRSNQVKLGKFPNGLILFQTIFCVCWSIGKALEEVAI